MKPRPPRVPPVVNCGNPACGRPLDTASYMTGAPRGNYPRHMIIEYFDEPISFAVHCTCGFYTVFRRDQRPLGC